jgi:hypothetical protein
MRKGVYRMKREREREGGVQIRKVVCRNVEEEEGDLQSMPLAQ